MEKVKYGGLKMESNFPHGHLIKGNSRKEMLKEREYTKQMTINSTGFGKMVHRFQEL